MTLYTSAWVAKWGWAAGAARQVQMQEFGHAVVQALFEGKEGSWLPLRVEIDTGADLTVLPERFASGLKAYSYPEQIVLHQVEPGSSVAGTLFKARAAYKEKAFMVPVAALEGEPTPLLGRTGFLDNFRVELRRDGFDVIPY